MKKLIIVFPLVTFFLISCQKDQNQDMRLTPLEQGNTGPAALPDNIVLSEAKVSLGKSLFYDKMLSKDNSISCASCHFQSNAFSDPARLSAGVDGTLGKRNAPAIINMADNTNGFFWDGRVSKLREQSLMPIEDHLEMKETLENVVTKLSENLSYLSQFELAFETSEINPLYISLALEQFMFSIISNNSKYDRFLAGEIELTDQENRGRQTFFGNGNNNGGNGNNTCASCHVGFNFENDDFANIGLDTENEILNDLGRGAITNNPNDNGKFKVPTLRNIELTAPYMHDGRFSTLEEVLDHYDNGIENSLTLNQEVRNLRGLNGDDKRDIIAFLKTLTDHTIATNPAFAE